MFKPNMAYLFLMAVLFLVTACSSNQAEAPAPSSEPPTTAVTDYNSTAENVFSLYEGEDMSTEDKVTNMLAQLEGMDWTEYNRLSSGKTLETLERCIPTGPLSNPNITGACSGNHQSRRCLCRAIRRHLR